MAISNVGIVGAGTMGNGIAQVCAASGLNVVMVDVSDDAVQRGFNAVEASIDRLVKKGNATRAEKASTLSRIRGSTSYDALSTSDIVIEAATENYQLKAQILKQIDEVLGPEAIIASNTSSISISKLASCTSRTGRFIGLHFFNPVPMMALVEIIRGLQTDDITHRTVEEFARKLGKQPISVRNNPGFVVNRILCPMINEAFVVLGEGLTSPEEIDKGLTLGAKHPIGPLALADLIGLDTMLAVMEVLYLEFSDPKYRPAMLLRELVAAGYLGQKTRRGVYTYG